MKVCLVVFRFGPSHGSILQTYALTKVLENLGHQVTIVNRIPAVDISSNLRRMIGDVVHKRISRHHIYMGEFPPILMKNLNRFIDANLRKKTITIKSESKLKVIGKMNFNAYVIGSDQTWRPGFVYNIYNYYLNFVPRERDVIRLSYAPSFGTDDWEYDKEQEETCKSLLSLFNGVSVREDSGIELCLRHLGRLAEHVLDPTLLLMKGDYLSVIQYKPFSESSFIGYNFLDYSDEKMRIVSIISHILELPAKQINSKTEYISASLKEQIAPSIDEWISGIYSSSFVIADSFHATVFSIIFHRPFITIANESRGLSRFISLLDMCSLRERLIWNERQITESLINDKIDWASVDDKIQDMKETSMEFLKRNLRNA